jgi:hypothetical protein
MNENNIITLIVLLPLLLIFNGCSQSKFTVLPGMESTNLLNYDSPLVDTASDLSENDINIIGLFELTVDSEKKIVDLAPKRPLSLGESYLISGLSFFTKAPCVDCLKLTGVNWRPDGLDVLFQITHPFLKGNINLPPSSVNRLDLDVFDCEMVINPYMSSPTPYSLTGVNIHPNLCQPDGYTTELADFLEENTALPFFLVVDDTDSGSNTWNRFEMGSSHEFSVRFTSVANLHVDLFLTMGSGVSAAKKKDRLAPKYYNPEFNRKAAWKVEVTPQCYWSDSDSTTPVNIEVKIYDWQTGATVYPLDDFHNAPADNVYASSEVATVSVEIPGMNDSLQIATSPSSGSGMPNNPLIYNIPVVNENLLSAGKYYGLVKVTDERETGQIYPIPVRDYLIHTEDGLFMEPYIITEYATYQVFSAEIRNLCPVYNQALTWGGTEIDLANSIALDQDMNTFVTGYFSNSVDFNPGGGNPQSSEGGYDAYLSKFNSSGNWQWTKTWGGIGEDIGKSVAVDQAGNIYVTGHFSNTVDFGPDGGGTESSHGGWDVFLSKFDACGNWKWTKTWGGINDDSGSGLILDQADNIYVTGHFEDTVEFNPSGGGSKSTNGGDIGAFLSKFDVNGAWQWTQTWSGTLPLSRAYGYSVCLDQSDNIYITGIFLLTVNFNPDGTIPKTPNGSYDAYLSKFEPDGDWLWVKTWGGSDYDVGQKIISDQSDNIYIVGAFKDTVDFNPGEEGVYSKTSHGDWDAYISKFDSDGIWIWSKTWGGTGEDYSSSICLDPSDYLYTTGSFQSTVDFNPNGGGTRSSNGGKDIFLSKLDSSGNWICAKTWGGTSNDTGLAVASSQAGNICASGNFRSTVDFDPPSGEEHTSNGDIDAFLWKGDY